MPAFIRLGISGADIRIKSNARLTYLDPQQGGGRVTAKIALASEVRSGSLAREIKARKLIPRIAASLPVPALFRHDKNLRWLVEQYVWPAERSAADKTGEFLSHHANGLYAPSARSRPVSQWLRRLGVAWSDLEQVFNETGAVLAPSEGEARWPVSLLHGDLSPGNMIAGRDGRFYLVDWEKFGAGPVAWDLKKLFLQAPDPVEKLLHTLSGPGDIEPATQLRIVAALELILRRRDRAGRLEYLTSHLGKSQNEAAQFLNNRHLELLGAVSGRSAAGTIRGNNAATD
jgi:hypothetical protein